jgi:predicted neutral ceramidase superfamily lipid hydrolase
MRVNLVMHSVRPQISLRTWLRTLSDLVPSPLTAMLAVISIAIVIAIAVVTVTRGRLPASGPIELVCAFVLAAVATAEASRPARSERLRRRAHPPRVSDEDQYAPVHRRQLG